MISKDVAWQRFEKPWQLNSIPENLLYSGVRRLVRLDAVVSPTGTNWARNITEQIQVDTGLNEDRINYLPDGLKGLQAIGLSLTPHQLLLVAKVVWQNSYEYAASFAVEQASEAVATTNRKMMILLKGATGNTEYFYLESETYGLHLISFVNQQLLR